MLSPYKKRFLNKEDHYRITKFYFNESVRFKILNINMVKIIGGFYYWFYIHCKCVSGLLIAIVGLI